MANNYEQIMALVNAGNKMGLSNTITRDNGIPLDLSSVYSSYEEAVVYAATKAIAYHGQPVAVITSTDATLYVITPVSQGKITVGETEYDVFLKQVGAKTEGDEKSITLSEDGVLSLAGFAAAAGATLPQKQADGTIKWVAIDAIVEGDGNTKSVVTSDDTQIVVTPSYDEESDTYTYTLSLDVDFGNYYTKEEVDAAVKVVSDKVGVEASEGVEATGLYKLIADALAEAKKYADDNDADTIYDDTALAARVKALEDEERYDDTALANRVTAVEGVAASNTTAIETEKTRAEAAEKALGERIDAIDYVTPQDLEDAVNAGIEEANGYTDEKIEAVNDAISKLNHFTAKVVESIDEVTEEGVLYLIKDASVEGVDKYNEYIVVSGEAVLIGDTTTDLSDYYTKSDVDGIVDGIEEAIADEVEAREALAQEVADLKAVDNATQAEFDAYKEEVTSAIATAKSEAIADADGKLAEKVAISDFETFQTENTEAIATAKQEAIDAAAQAEEAKGYAVATEVAETYATKQSVTDLNNTINATLNDYAKTADVNAELAKKIDKATISHSTEEKAEGATVTGTHLDIVVDAFTKAETRQYVADTIKTMTGGESAADVKLLLENHIAEYEEKVGQIDAKDGAQDTAIAAAQAQADKGVADAKTANDAISALTTGAVAANTSDITTIKGRLDTLETAKGDHESRISSAEGTIRSLVAEDQALNAAVGEINGEITALKGADAELSGAITALQNTKADASTVYTKTETDKQIGDAIKAIPAVDLTPYAKSADVDAALAIKANAADVYSKTDADGKFMTEGQVDDRINALIVASDPEGGKTITDIQNLVKYVDENAGEIAALITKTDANSAKLAGIDTTVTAAIESAIAAIVMPKSSEEVTVAADGTLGLGKVSTDKLEMGTETLVIDGGTASV